MFKTLFSPFPKQILETKTWICGVKSCSPSANNVLCLSRVHIFSPQEQFFLSSCSTAEKNKLNIYFKFVSVKSLKVFVRDLKTSSFKICRNVILLKNQKLNLKFKLNLKSKIFWIKIKMNLKSKMKSKIFNLKSNFKLNLKLILY